MSHYMTALAMKQPSLKPATKIVLYWLADHHNGETGECFPSIKRLAELCEMSRRSVETHITSLEEAGLVKRIAQYRNTGGKTTNKYLLELSGTPWDSDDTQDLRIGGAEFAGGDPQKLRMNNQVIRNHGREYFIDDLFETFWRTYPRKINKAAAKESFITACRHTKPGIILDAARDYGNAMLGQEKQFIPHPRTWLRQKRYLEKVEVLNSDGTLKALKSMGLNYE